MTLTVTHYAVPRGLRDMEVIRPSCQVGHVEGHIELQKKKKKNGGEEDCINTEFRGNWKTEKIHFEIRRSGIEIEKNTVSVRWSRLTEVKRSRSLQQNLRNVVIAFAIALCLNALFFSFDKNEKECNLFVKWSKSPQQHIVQKPITTYGPILDLKFPYGPSLSNL